MATFYIVSSSIVVVVVVIVVRIASGSIKDPNYTYIITV